MSVSLVRFSDAGAVVANSYIAPVNTPFSMNEEPFTATPVERPVAIRKSILKKRKPLLLPEEAESSEVGRSESLHVRLVSPQPSPSEDTAPSTAPQPQTEERENQRQVETSSDTNGERRRRRHAGHQMWIAKGWATVLKVRGDADAQRE